MGASTTNHQGFSIPRDDRGPLEQQRARCEAELFEEVCDTLRNMGQQDTQDAVDALDQLAAGTYGYCLECREPISQDRMNALTFAVRCARCAHAHRMSLEEEDEDAPARPQSLLSLH